MDAAFVALYQAAYPRLVRTLAIVAGNPAEAEEVVQDAFIRLLSKWPTVSSYDDPEAWVRMVAFRLLSNRARNSRTLLRFLHRAQPAPPGAPPPDDRLDIARALALIATEQRVVIVLHHLVGLPVAQIADELGVPVGTVKSRLSRARTALAPLLEEEIPDHA